MEGMDRLGEGPLHRPVKFQRKTLELGAALDPHDMLENHFLAFVSTPDGEAGALQRREHRITQNLGWRGRRCLTLRGLEHRSSRCAEQRDQRNLADELSALDHGATL